MKKLITMFCTLLALSSGCLASSPTLELITQPLYWGDSEKGVQYGKVPKIMNHTHPTLIGQWYSSPTRVTGHKVDLNLISVYGVKVDGGKGTGKNNSWAFTVDLSKAKKSNHHPFTVQEVGVFAAKAIREDYKDSMFKIEIFIFDGTRKIAYLGEAKDTPSKANRVGGRL